VGISVGKSLSIETQPGTSFSLTPENPIATIDYGVERGGFPLFSVSALDGPVEIEVKYSEAFDSLSHPYGDGPYFFTVMLANSFRVETFNLSSTGQVQSTLVQGGQRWETIKLLTNGSVTFDHVGLTASTSTINAEDLPGTFDCDDEALNEIWRLGARAATSACLRKGTQGPTWQVDPNKGIFVRSQIPAFPLGVSVLEDYTLEFDAMIERGGLWWTVVRRSHLYHIHGLRC
jgi:hypothetical protein